MPGTVIWCGFYLQKSIGKISSFYIPWGPTPIEEYTHLLTAKKHMLYLEKYHQKNIGPHLQILTCRKLTQ